MLFFSILNVRVCQQSNMNMKQQNTQQNELISKINRYVDSKTHLQHINVKLLLNSFFEVFAFCSCIVVFFFFFFSRQIQSSLRFVKNLIFARIVSNQFDRDYRKRRYVEKICLMLFVERKAFCCFRNLEVKFLYFSFAHYEKKVLNIETTCKRRVNKV